MKKYVLNIEKLYSGQTANSLILNQVEDDFPLLIPCIVLDSNNNIPDRTNDICIGGTTLICEGDEDTIVCFSSDAYQTLETIGKFLEKWKRIYPKFDPDIDISSTIDRDLIDKLNEYIMDFNLNLQTEFKQKSHNEVYMMDDTEDIRSMQNTFSNGKKYLHSLNGISEIKDFNSTINLSQLNVIFPFKKIQDKSLYSTQLVLDTDFEIDQKLEMVRSITMQGRVSYEKCVQSITTVGNNLYVMSPELELYSQNIYSNGISIVNGGNQNFVFPNSMTLFQHSPIDIMSESNLVKDFLEWYEKHDHKIVVEYEDIYGSNVSSLTYLGKSSYEVKLATYSPNIGYYQDSDFILLESSQNKKLEEGNEVGFLFNLYDTFITGQKRIIRLKVPVDRNFNELELVFDTEEFKSNILTGELTINVQVLSGNEIIEPLNGRYNIQDTSIDNIQSDGFNGRIIDISVLMYYDVDFSKRNNNQEYIQALKKSGIILKNISIENKVTEQNEHLTFGSYVNEYGISDAERKKRYSQFWTIAQYRTCIAYQTVLESSLRNISTSRFEYRNNYSTGDMYGDVFVTKSVLDPLYNMQIDEKEGALTMPVRDYIGLGSCSNQLSLIYNQARMKFNNNQKTVTVNRVDNYDGMRYQMVETVKNINRFESSIKHKSNVFSVIVNNSNLSRNPNADIDDEFEKYKESLRNSVSQFVRNVCDGIVPVHTQLFDVQFT